MEQIEADSSQPIFLTKEGMTKLKKELAFLTVDKRAEIAERIRASKDHGEFSEDNNELDEVKMEQAIVENRINELKTILSNAEVLTKRNIPSDSVGIGSYATVKDVDNGVEFEIRVVSSVEANPDEDLISVEAPMGEALLGKELGSVAEFEAPAGVVKYKVTAIRR
jgi:transcription elongation factor GreA